MKHDSWKDFAARKVGSALASDAAMKVLNDPRVQTAMLRALNARGELRGAVERRVSSLATALDLATHDDVAGLRRTIRNLEDTLEELRGELEEAQDSAARAQATAQATAATVAASSEAAATAATEQLGPSKGRRGRKVGAAE